MLLFRPYTHILIIIIVIIIITLIIVLNRHSNKNKNKPTVFLILKNSFINLIYSIMKLQIKLKIKML